MSVEYMQNIMDAFDVGRCACTAPLSHLQPGVSQVDTEDDAAFVRLVEADRAQQLRRDGSAATGVPPPMLAGPYSLGAASLAVLARLSSAGCVTGAVPAAGRAAAGSDTAAGGAIASPAPTDCVMRLLRIRLLEMAHGMNALAAKVATHADQIRGSGHAPGYSKFRARTRTRMSTTYNGEVTDAITLFNDTVRRAS